MIKTTGAEFLRFYNDETIWPEGAWHDDETILVNGQEVDHYAEDTIEADAQISIEHGVVFKDERGEVELGSFEGYFKKWRKAQNTVFLTVEAPKEKLNAIKAAIRTAGGRIA